MKRPRCLLDTETVKGGSHRRLRHPRLVNPIPSRRAVHQRPLYEIFCERRLNRYLQVRSTTGTPHGSNWEISFLSSGEVSRAILAIASIRPERTFRGTGDDGVVHGGVNPNGSCIPGVDQF
jgi:hypothetical protein